MEAREPGRRAPHPLRAPLCAGFLYVTILRNPLARIAADYCMNEHDRANPFEVLARANRAFDAMADARDAAGEAFAGARASNYYVRILLGERIYRLHALPPNALAAANATLHAFDVVIILEQLERQMPLLQRRLGWTDASVEAWRAQPRPNHLTPPGCSHLNWSTSRVEGFRKANQLDLELYDHWLGETERRIAQTMAHRRQDDHPE
jgi:hypothetical protein